MPIYEFYCSDCHMIFNFLSKTPDTTKQPGCPRCKKRRLERQISLFAISKGRQEGSGDEPDLDIDESKLEQAMASLEREAEGMSEDDPRGMARMLRKLYDGAGLRMGEGMEEAMRRMEAGEDPDKIEEEMGDVLGEEEDLFAAPGGGRLPLADLKHKLRPPKVDDTLYEM